MTDTDADEARDLLERHADRTLTGTIEDPGVLAAVVGVERLVVALDTDDAARIRETLAGRSGSEHLAAVVADVEEQVRAGIADRGRGDQVDAGTINPDAGGHEIVTDATLVRAGVRAAQRSYDAMPYYRARYGDRGSRFASTDSGWLLSLAPHEPAYVVRQVRWLSRVLANRGMPSWLLETHLTALVAEVRAVAPDRVGRLPTGAEDLAAARRAHVDDDLLAQADRWADDALGVDRPVPHTGLLLAAAVADVLAGVRPDDEPLVGWLTDEARVDAGTAATVRDLRDRVRAAARG